MVEPIVQFVERLYIPRMIKRNKLVILRIWAGIPQDVHSFYGVYQIVTTSFFVIGAGNAQVAFGEHRLVVEHSTRAGYYSRLRDISTATETESPRPQFIIGGRAPLKKPLFGRASIVL